jgi:hypothetical protein
MVKALEKGHNSSVENSSSSKLANFFHVRQLTGIEEFHCIYIVVQIFCLITILAL